jgi:hypothetical protein
MAGPTIPKSLAGLIGKMGVRPGGLGDGSGAKGGPAGLRGEGMAAEGELAPGAELGPDGVLSAKIGYAGRDRRTQLRNLVEKANVHRFLAEREGEGPKLPRTLREGAAREGGDARAPREGKEAEAREARARQGGEQTEAAKKDDGREVLLRDPHGEGGIREGETREARAEEERGRGDDDGERRGGSGEDGEDEEERPGWGWVAEEAEERERRRKFTLEGADPMGAANRCRGHLDDGSPCLRKPMDGTPFCREHRYT